MIAELLDEGLNVSPGLLEDHGSNGPTIGIRVSVFGKEVACENSSCRFVPSVARSPCKMKSEGISRATVSELRVPVCYILVGDSIFEPIVIANQGFHVKPNVRLYSGVTTKTRI